MKIVILCAALAVLPAGAGAADTKPKPPAGAKGPAAPPAAAEPKTEDEKTVYAVGLVLGRNLGQLDLSPAEVELVKRGFADAASGATPLVELDAYGPKIQQFAKARVDARLAVEREKGKAFQEAALKDEGALKTASGLIIRTLSPGTGDSPKPTDTVKVHYEGTLVDGTVFDSSVKRGQPMEIKLDGVIPCWTEGVQRMKVGEKARLVCPAEIAYGDRGRPPVIAGGATLVFEVELIEIAKPAPAASPAPSPTPPPSH